jgi:hypothetical protein
VRSLTLPEQLATLVVRAAPKPLRLAKPKTADGTAAPGAAPATTPASPSTTSSGASSRAN